MKLVIFKTKVDIIKYKDQFGRRNHRCDVKYNVIAIGTKFINCDTCSAADTGECRIHTLYVVSPKIICADLCAMNEYMGINLKNII